MLGGRTHRHARALQAGSLPSPRDVGDGGPSCGWWGPEGSLGPADLDQGRTRRKEGGRKRGQEGMEGKLIWGVMET